MMRNRIFFVYLLLPLLIDGNQDFDRIEEETRLIRVLLKEKDYLKKVRPSQKVIVDFRLVFNQIISMVEKEQIIVTNCFVDQKWTGDVKINLCSLFLLKMWMWFYSELAKNSNFASDLVRVKFNT